MKLEVRAADPAFGQEPGHRGIHGQEKQWWERPLAWQLELEEGQKWDLGGVRASAQQTPLPCVLKLFLFLQSCLAFSI